MLDYIHKNPEDRAAQLAFADQLDECGEHVRAELIRVTCECDRLIDQVVDLELKHSIHDYATNRELIRLDEEIKKLCSRKDQLQKSLNPDNLEIGWLGGYPFTIRVHTVHYVLKEVVGKWYARYDLKAFGKLPLKGVYVSDRIPNMSMELSNQWYWYEGNPVLSACYLPTEIFNHLDGRMVKFAERRLSYHNSYAEALDAAARAFYKFGTGT